MSDEKNPYQPPETKSDSGRSSLQTFRVVGWVILFLTILALIALFVVAALIKSR